MATKTTPKRPGGKQRQAEPKAPKAEPKAPKAEPKPKLSQAETLAQYRAKYGKESNCGDEIANKLAGLDHDALVALAERNGIDFQARWGHCNRGSARMNLGNVLRARLRRGEPVTINEKAVK